MSVNVAAPPPTAAIPCAPPLPRCLNILSYAPYAEPFRALRGPGVRDLRSDKQTHADLDLLVADAASVVVVEELVERTDAGYRFGKSDIGKSDRTHPLLLILLLILPRGRTRTELHSSASPRGRGDTHRRRDTLTRSATSCRDVWLDVERLPPPKERRELQERLMSICHAIEGSFDADVKENCPHTVSSVFCTLLVD